MNITRNLITALLMTVVTTLLLGVAYPLAVTGLALSLTVEDPNRFRGHDHVWILEGVRAQPHRRSEILYGFRRG